MDDPNDYEENAACGDQVDDQFADPTEHIETHGNEAYQTTADAISTQQMQPIVVKWRINLTVKRMLHIVVKWMINLTVKRMMYMVVELTIKITLYQTINELYSHMPRINYQIH